MHINDIPLLAAYLAFDLANNFPAMNAVHVLPVTLLDSLPALAEHPVWCVASECRLESTSSALVAKPIAGSLDKFKLAASGFIHNIVTVNCAADASQYSERLPLNVPSMSEQEGFSVPRLRADTPPF